MENKFKPTALVINYSWKNAKILTSQAEVDQTTNSPRLQNVDYDLYTADTILDVYDSEDSPPAEAMELYARLKNLESGYDELTDLGDLP